MSLVFDSQNKSSLISISRFRFFVEVGKSSSSKELMSPIFLLTSRSCFLLQLKNRFLLGFLIARISFCASIPVGTFSFYNALHTLDFETEKAEGFPNRLIEWVKVDMLYQTLYH